VGETGRKEVLLSVESGKQKHKVLDDLEEIKKYLEDEKELLVIEKNKRSKRLSLKLRPNIWLKLKKLKPN